MTDFFAYDKMEYQQRIQAFPFPQEMWEGEIAVAAGYPLNGMETLWVAANAPIQAVTVYSEDAMDPYPELIHWLEKIAQDNLPCDFEIDQGGEYMTLRAFPSTNDRLDFRISHTMLDDDDLDSGTILRTLVSKHQFLVEFTNALDNLTMKYQPDRWPYGTDLSKLDLSTLRKYLAANPENRRTRA